MKNIKLNYLKVKIQNLADEAKYIRKNEVKADRKLRALKLRNKLAAKQLMTPVQITRTIKKSRGLGVLDGNLRIGVWGNGSYFMGFTETEQDPSWLDYQHKLKVELKEHRKTIVRDEARASQIAYAFLRGKDYAEIETNAKPHDIIPSGVSNKMWWFHGDKIWDRVESIAFGFSEKNSSEEDYDAFKKQFDTWKGSALKFLREKA